MNITDVRIRKMPEDNKLLAIVSVTFDEEFVIHDIKLIEGEKGRFIAMPSKKMGEGDFRDIAHPINSEARGKLQDAIMEKYELMEMETKEAANKDEQHETAEFTVEIV